MERKWKAATFYLDRLTSNGDVSPEDEYVHFGSSDTPNVLLLSDMNAATVYYALLEKRDKYVRELYTRQRGAENYSAEDDLFLSTELRRITRLLFAFEEHRDALMLVRSVGETQ